MTKFRRSAYSAFALMGIVVVILIALQFLPPFTLFGHEMRPVKLFSDIEKKDAPETVRLATEDTQEHHAKAKKKLPKKPVEIINDYSIDNEHGLQKFYEALQNIPNQERPVRIAFYGDSYVESDLLTCDLRERFQDVFGGAGAGWIDCGTTTNSERPTVKQSESGFNSHATIDKEGFNTKRQGIAERYFTVSGFARLSLNSTPYKKHTSSWSESSLFLMTHDAITVTATSAYGTETFTVTANKHIQQLTTGRAKPRTIEGEVANRDDDSEATDKERRTMRNVKWEISDTIGATYYGVTCDHATGVTIDNFAMRGNSGMRLASIPQTTLNEFGKLRPYDLIILQYGLNSYSPKLKKEWFDMYARAIGRAIQKLKEAYPDAAIVVASIPLRGDRKDGNTVMMSGIERMVECQKRIAKENNVVFMNLYELMGGEEGLKTHIEKGYIGHDFTHITFEGGRYLSRQMYNAIMKAYP
ncbi:MAG: hypothetical protein Q4F34_09275 [Prevotellaceae bacterium]|nr:hypothetical protein [Prevotellaceae bacterium]